MQNDTIFEELNVKGMPDYLSQGHLNPTPRAKLNVTHEVYFYRIIRIQAR